MKRAFFLLALLAALLVAGGALLVRSTFPPETGSLQVPGLAAPVEVIRDAHGIPSIRAGSLPDLFFAQGFVTAQDRLWQMEFQRRVGRGALAEILGPRLLETDRFLRTLGFRRAAARAWADASPVVRAELSAYARGVNASIRISKARPLELRLLRFAPGPFDEIDLLTWPKLMAWDLGSRGGGLFDEIERARLTARLGERRAGEFLAPGSADFPILADGEWGPAARSDGPPSTEAAPSPEARLVAGLSPLRDLARGLGFDAEAAGSNSWVLAGSRTTTGRPILANDPHLGFRAPSVWHLVDLRAPGFHAVGAALPGVPGIIIGRNDRIAWGLTNIGPDVQDLYVEKVDPGDSSFYRYRGERRRFEARREVIRVRGQRDAVVTIRESVHGPIVSDVVRGAGELGSAVALRWTAIDPAVPDRGSQAFIQLMAARDWKEFLAAVSLFAAPAQNFLYADADGHIGYTASGVIPRRPRASGLLPVSGEGADEWLGFIPFDALPRCLDPARGFLVTANNAVASSRYPYALSRDWPEPYRARRITDLILAKPKLSVSDVAAIQLDRVSYQARDLLPLLAATRPDGAASAELLSLLKGWDGSMERGSAAAAAYAAWYTELSRGMERRLGGVEAAVRTRFLANALSDPALASWCDDPMTARVETCEDFKTESLARAATLLRRKLGANSAGWRWEDLHTAHFPHAVFDRVAGLRLLFSLSAPAGGDASTVNVGAYRRDDSFTMLEGPSYRQVIDFANPDADLFVNTTGESGNVFDRRYRDGLPLWRDGKSFTINGPGPLRTLRLLP